MKEVFWLERGRVKGGGGSGAGLRLARGTADVVQHFRSCGNTGSLMRDASGWACRRSGLGRRMLLVRRRQTRTVRPTQRHGALAI